jgi:hypothetical protein
MKSRTFIKLLGGAATAWPLAARAAAWRSDVAHWRNRARRCERCSHWTFGQAFQESGWSIGRNVHLDIRWTAPNDTKISPASGEVGCARAGRSRKWTALWLRAGGRCGTSPIRFKSTSGTKPKLIVWHKLSGTATRSARVDKTPNKAEDVTSKSIASSG